MTLDWRAQEMEEATQACIANKDHGQKRTIHCVCT
jgi:hypothetical protein